MLKTKLGAIGLSINVLVIIIISLVVLGGGIALLYNFIGSATEFKQQLDQNTQQQIERLLINEQQLVALPLNSVTLQRGDAQVFGLGILNIKEKGNFQIVITPPTTYINEFNEVQEVTKPVNWLLYTQEPIVIGKDSHVKESLLVQVPKDVYKGTYSFKLRVERDGESYGNLQRFSVMVK